MVVKLSNSYNLPYRFDGLREHIKGSLKQENLVKMLLPIFKNNHLLVVFNKCMNDQEKTIYSGKMCAADMRKKISTHPNWSSN